MVALTPGALIISETAERYFPIRIKDWERLRAKAESLQKKRREFSGFAWAMVGLVVTSIFALMAWLPAYAALPMTGKFENAWLTPVFVLAIISGSIMAAGGFWGSHLFADSERATAAEIVSDMDAIFQSA
jgi:hypothetical protein